MFEWALIGWLGILTWVVLWLGFKMNRLLDRIVRVETHHGERILSLDRHTNNPIGSGISTSG